MNLSTKKHIAILLFLEVVFQNVFSQTNLLTYAGGAGRETFYDVLRLSDGTFLVAGYADDLDWLSPDVPRSELQSPISIPNAQGQDNFGFLLRFSADLQMPLELVHFAKGAVEDVRFIKTNTLPGAPTGDLFISCNTSDTDAKNGGYLLAKLDKNFLNGTPTALEWAWPVWAKSYAKTAHPWDVTSDGRVFYVTGESHGYDWSALYCLDAEGKRTRVENWRTHWLANGTEWRGTPASANPLGSADSVLYSGLVLKSWGRCELRSWTAEDFNAMLPDGNGGTKKGTWPADFMFDAPCDPTQPSGQSPGYNGYSPEGCCPVWGASSLVVDRRDNHFYLGMNFKTYSQTAASPDFEPAVIAFDDSGTMLWWSRLYHEITPDGDTMQSLPDQYVDALAIDFSKNCLVVAARAHGNNVENLWEGNTVAANPGAAGFQNRFTGTNGNIHESWLGKLRLSDGILENATYVAELAEDAGGLGVPHPDPNLDAWPNPNSGWPDVNTTRIAKNALKITASGDVCMLGVGRRTITTANAFQKMVKPNWGGKSCWNSFVRVYDADFRVPKYSSLLVGAWDTLTGAGGDNTEFFGLWKTESGVVAVGRHTANATGLPNGNSLPVAQVPFWGKSAPENESAVLAYLQADALFDENDGISKVGNSLPIEASVVVFPNPTSGSISLKINDLKAPGGVRVQIFDAKGSLVFQKENVGATLEIGGLARGVYFLKVKFDKGEISRKIIVQ